MEEQQYNTQDPALCSALVKAIAETQNVMADAQNPFHKNSYATLGAHLDQIKPIFAKHGLAILQFPIGSGDVIGINTIILHKDGGEINRVCTIPATEGLKAQEAGSIFSYLRRYALASVAGVATNDDDGEINRVVQTAKFIPNEKFVPNENFKPAAAPAPKPIPKPAVAVAQTSGDRDLAQALGFIVPFGKNKGLTLGELQEKSLDWYIKEYQPKPYMGKISEKDTAFRNALDLIRDSRSGSVAEAADEPEDNVPF